MVHSPLRAFIVGVAVLAATAGHGVHAGVRPLHLSAQAVASTARIGAPDASDGLVFTGEMLFGGVLLMACSAYALRRARRREGRRWE
jgi:hypothetical protein